MVGRADISGWLINERRAFIFCVYTGVVGVCGSVCGVWLSRSQGVSAGRIIRGFI